MPHAVDQRAHGVRVFERAVHHVGPLALVCPVAMRRIEQAGAVAGAVGLFQIFCEPCFSA